MDKIYLVVCGEYSDWRVLGFFEKYEDAERYCALRNRDGGDCGDELSVMACENPNAEGLENIKVGYIWKAFYNIETKELVKIEKIDVPSEERESYIEKLIFSNIVYYCRWLAVDDPRANEEAFRKIACDRFARWLYEHKVEDGGNEQ